MRLELDEVVMLFPCGMLAFYYLSKVGLAHLGSGSELGLGLGLGLGF